MKRRRWAWIAGGTVAAACGLYLAAGSILIAPVRQHVPPPPAFLHTQQIRLPSPSGATLAAWLLERLASLGYASPSLEPGLQDVRSAVSVVFELK